MIEKKCALKQLDLLIDDYEFNCFIGFELITTKSMRDKIFGAIYYAYFIGIIDKEELEKYKTRVDKIYVLKEKEGKK